MSQNVSPGESRRIPELDGLRGIAIGLVVVYHYVVLWFDTPLLLAPLGSAWSGVDLFFVLSGFLIGGILLDTVDAKNYYAAFYVRRFYRILPLYFLFVLIVLPLEPVPHKWTWLFFLQNALMYIDSHVFKVAALSVTWSLAVEEQFYALLPLTIRLLRRQWLLVGVVLWVLASPLIRFAMRNPGGLEWIMLPGRGDSLGLGMLCAILVRSTRWDTVRRQGPALALTTVVFAAVAALCIRTGTLREFSPKYTFLGLAYASLLLLALTRQVKVVTATLTSPPLQFLGRVSYFVYLAHWAVREVVFNVIPGLWTPTIIALTATFLLSELSWRWLEKPMIQRGHQTKYQLHAVSRAV